MRQINPEHIGSLLHLINNGPYFKLLAMDVCELGTGYAMLKVDLQKKHHNPFGIVHGGVYSSVIDTAAYWAVYCELDENAGYTSIDLSVDNLSAIREGEIVVEGRSIKIGKTICLAEATVKDTHGRMLAHGTSKLMVLNERQSIEVAIAAMGFQPLPPKFI